MSETPEKPVEKASHVRRLLGKVAASFTVEMSEDARRGYLDLNPRVGDDRKTFSLALRSSAVVDISEWEVHGRRLRKAEELAAQTTDMRESRQKWLELRADAQRAIDEAEEELAKLPNEEVEKGDGAALRVAATDFVVATPVE